MWSTFATILDVAKSLLGMSDQLKAANRQRRNDMADLFLKIGDCLSAVATEIRARKVPYGRCSELSTYADALPGVVRKELGPEKADQLGATLMSAYNVEAVARDILAEAKLDKKLRDSFLREIDEAAGKFQALGNLLRAA